MSSTTTTTATKTTTRTAGPYALAATPLAMATSQATSTSYTSGDTSTGTPPPTTATPPFSSARVRFDAECVLIPDLGLGAGSKRPRMVTKSYSLPLWRKAGHSEEEDAHAHVVLKVALPRPARPLLASFILLLLPAPFISMRPCPHFRAFISDMEMKARPASALLADLANVNVQGRRVYPSQFRFRFLGASHIVPIVLSLQS
ncbi:hypothetical protein C8R47DRAFT_138438 [Mycena vitilis]|nr:hypothetical protein C8R47DRAFT_138438 [Mycena vitilis]